MQVKLCVITVLTYIANIPRSEKGILNTSQLLTVHS
jgi:hypothetical protein